MSESRGEGKRPIKKTPKMKSYNKTLDIKTPLPQQKYMTPNPK